MRARELLEHRDEQPAGGGLERSHLDGARDRLGVLERCGGRLESLQYVPAV